MVRVLVPAVVAGLLLAGCSYDDRRPDEADGDGGQGTTSNPPSPEADNGVFYVTFEAGDGPATLEVPFPTLDSCRGADHWAEGNVTADGVDWEVRDATGGRTGQVLAVTGEGSVSWQSEISPGPACMTLRYDPWTVDPDPETDPASVDVRLVEGSVATASVLVRQVRGGCGNATLYEGTPAESWTGLEGRSVPTGC